MKVIKKDYSVIIFILIICFSFFSKLFYPKPSLFYTPDFGRSDIWNFNYPAKDFLSRSLKKGELPFWNKNVGTGFPFLAEGEIGALNIFNLILFFLFPTWLAWNISFPLIFFFCFLGTYLFLKKNGLDKLACFFSGFVFSFSGFFIAHITHFNHLQSASFLPWLFLTAQNLLQEPKKRNIFFFAFILAQQIFSGHPQNVFISLIGIGIFYLFHFFKQKKDNLLKVKKTLLFLFALVLGIALAAPQILPILKLTQLSSRNRGLNSKTIFQYPYPFKHIITFFLPNFFGTPKDGTYPAFGSRWGIYWENTAYLGILPLILMILSLFSPKKSFKKIFWFLLVFSFLLVLGKNSPLYFLFSFPGFNFFRVPSRFLILTAFSIAVLSAFGFDYLISFLSKKIKSKKILLFIPALRRGPRAGYCLAGAIYCLLFTAIFDLFHFGFSYHPLVSVNHALEPPKTAEIIPENARIFTDPRQMKFWNDFFLTQGWQEPSPYLYFKNSLSPNLNLLFQKSQTGYYECLAPTRLNYFQKSLNRNLINASATKYIISPEKIEEAENLQLIKTVKPPKKDLPEYFVYQDQKVLNRFRFASNYKVEKTLNGFLRTVNQEEFSFKETVILEKDLSEEFEKLNIAEIRVVKNKDQKLILQTNTDKKTILIIADSFYPRWKAKIDGQETKILPANLNQRAIILPAGKHIVEMSYFPKAFWQGVVISLISLAIFTLIRTRPRVN